MGESLQEKIEEQLSTIVTRLRLNYYGVGNDVNLMQLEQDLAGCTAWEENDGDAD